MHKDFSFNKIAILGCGGIGRSIVLAALAKSKECVTFPSNDTCTPNVFDGTQIVVYDIDPDAKLKLLASDGYQKLLQENRITPEIIDQRVIFTHDDPSVVAGAELINFAIPVDQYAATARMISPYIDPAYTVITDEGSIKEAAINRAVNAFKEYFGDNVPPFVGYHIPNHDYPTKIGFFVETDYSTSRAVDMVERFRVGLGAEKFFRVSAAEHDTLYGTSSHLNYVNMSSLLQTQFMQSATGQVGDPGDWIKSMISITQTSPVIWPGIFMDNIKGLLNSAYELGKLLTHHAALLKEGNFSRVIDKLHRYAHDKPSEKISPMAGNISPHLSISAFAAFFSAAATANVERLEMETGVTIAEYANPSCRQSLGIMANDPGTAKILLEKYQNQIPDMLNSFLSEFNAVQQTIQFGGYEGILEFCNVSYDREQTVRQTLDDQSFPFYQL